MVSVFSRPGQSAPGLTATRVGWAVASGRQDERAVDSDGLDLDGAQVLLAEDSFLLALDLQGVLAAAGGHVLGPVASVAAGLALLARQRPDLALLDVELQDGWVTPLAEALAHRGVPFLLVTGYAGDQLDPPLLQAAPRLAKPWSEPDLVQALRQLWWRHRVGQRAYALWEQENRPAGQAEQHWRMAEAQLLAGRQAQAAVTVAGVEAAASHHDHPDRSPRDER
jgi:CheY-like chemotaxis protein